MKVDYNEKHPVVFMDLKKSLRYNITKLDMEYNGGNCHAIRVSSCYCQLKLTIDS